jgi:hypothetical protein
VDTAQRLNAGFTPLYTLSEGGSSDKACEAPLPGADKVEPIVCIPATRLARLPDVPDCFSALVVLTESIIVDDASSAIGVEIDDGSSTRCCQVAVASAIVRRDGNALLIEDEDEELLAESIVDLKAALVLWLLILTLDPSATPVSSPSSPDTGEMRKIGSPSCPGKKADPTEELISS